MQLETRFAGDRNNVQSLLPDHYFDLATGFTTLTLASATFSPLPWKLKPYNYPSGELSNIGIGRWLGAHTSPINSSQCIGVLLIFPSIMWPCDVTMWLSKALFYCVRREGSVPLWRTFQRDMRNYLRSLAYSTLSLMHRLITIGSAVAPFHCHKSTSPRCHRSTRVFVEYFYAGVLTEYWALGTHLLLCITRTTSVIIVERLDCRLSLVRGGIFCEKPIKPWG